MGLDRGAPEYSRSIQITSAHMTTRSYGAYIRVTRERL